METTYASPTVEVVEIKIEKGFAASSEGGATEGMDVIQGEWDF